ncbi:MAG: hypothetical protein RLO04_05090 [Limnobacter sp.]|uniref:hypothetical protein n=1 Tax=Limnobacter sp. TaxID=2003368 RepID=UPI0032ED2494
MWWEKTVEYLFAIRHIEPKALFAPLAGMHEVGGDLMAAQGDRWVLIEFKRNEESISDELRKFPSPAKETFAAAKADLQHRDGHHMLVYGCQGQASSLELRACTYFSKIPVEARVVLSQGVLVSEFNDYLTELQKHKDGGTKSGVGGYSPNYASVMAVNGEGQVVHCEGLNSYGERHGLWATPTPDPTPQPSHGTSGPGM